jgi:hypothetical protein
METIQYIEPAGYMPLEEPVDLNAPANEWRQGAISDYIWSCGIVILIMAAFVMQQPDQLLHWMLLPLFACGVIVTADAIRWLKGTYSLFDPKGIIGLYGINFFFTAPLLVVFYEMEGVETYIVSDWKPLLGIMAIFNVLGLIVYKLFEKIAFRRPTRAESTYWAVNHTRAALYVPLFVTVAFISFCIYMVRGGGLSGVLLQEKQGEINMGLVGGGVFMVLRDALPMTVLIGLTIYRLSKGVIQKSSWWFFLGMGMLVLYFVTSGLRGSRAAIGLGLICAGGVIHYFWKQLSVKTVLLTLIPLLAFFFFYSFYKSAGLIGISDLFQGRSSVRDLQEETSRTFAGMLVGDLSRAPVQAVEVDILINKPWSYRYRYGKTYPLAIAYLLPRQIWPSKPMDTARIVAGTEMLYGEGTHSAYVKFGGSGSRSTQLYGLAGEAMLNFGLYGILPAFAIWGYIIGKIRRRLYSYKTGDLRLLMSGFWMLITFVMLASDADQLVWFFTSLYVIPAFLIFLISDRTVVNESY